mmetsp:Transcript_22060/g.49810  ORF Transcript_22060/g.49810 Transcript_22060/m.49810 type:complete len:229 (-) Transcript_22060:144-830(-)
MRRPFQCARALQWQLLQLRLQPHCWHRPLLRRPRACLLLQLLPLYATTTPPHAAIFASCLPATVSATSQPADLATVPAATIYPAIPATTFPAAIPATSVAPSSTTLATLAAASPSAQTARPTGSAPPTGPSGLQLHLPRDTAILGRRCCGFCCRRTLSRPRAQRRGEVCSPRGAARRCTGLDWGIKSGKHWGVGVERWDAARARAAAVARWPTHRPRKCPLRSAAGER